MDNFYSTPLPVPIHIHTDDKKSIYNTISSNFNLNVSIDEYGRIMFKNNKEEILFGCNEIALWSCNPPFAAVQHALVEMMGVTENIFNGSDTDNLCRKIQKEYLLEFIYEDNTSNLSI